MKLFIVLALSIMTLASMADVSDAKMDDCNTNTCTYEAKIPFCAVNSHGVRKDFNHSCDVTTYNCKYNEDFRRIFHGKCDSPPS